MNFTIELSPEEMSRGSWSAHHRSLAVQLLMCNGFVVVRGALPLDLVAALKRQFDDVLTDCLASAGGKPLQNIPWLSDGQTTFWIRARRLRAFVRIRDAFADPRLLTNPFAMQVLETVLGRGFYCNTLSSDVCLAGSLLQAPHRDTGFNPTRQTLGAIVNIPLMHCGAHNGPLEIWLGGTHLWTQESFELAKLGPFIQDGPNPALEAFAGRLPSVRLELFPGDILLRDPGTLHRGTPYPAGEPRVMLTASYFRTGVTYEYGDPSYNLDDELFEQLPASVRQVMEYRFRAKAELPPR